MIEVERQAILALANLAIANPGDPNEEHPLDWQVGALLVQRGWAALGSQYPLYRITQHGRRMLSVVVNPASAA
jgi:hypothetical protein